MSPDPNPEEALRMAVGHAVVEASRAELLLDIVHSNLAQSHENAVLGDRNTMGTTVLKCIKLLNRRRDLGTKQREGLDLLDELSDLTEIRNRVIHDVALTDQSPGQEGGIVLAKGLNRDVQKETPITIPEIFQLGEDFRRVSRALTIWGAENLGHQGQWEIKDIEGQTP
jgi:hypothetical protein